MGKYPMDFIFNTPDGEGEATKGLQGEPWEVNTPAFSFRFYGSKTQVKAEITKRSKQLEVSDE